MRKLAYILKKLLIYTFISDQWRINPNNIQISIIITIFITKIKLS